MVVSAREMWDVSNHIRHSDGSIQWFATKEERDRVWLNLSNAAHVRAELATLKRRTALQQELAERAAMYGMEP